MNILCKNLTMNILINCAKCYKIINMPKKNFKFQTISFGYSHFDIYVFCVMQSFADGKQRYSVMKET